MDKETLRMQMLAGVITEGEYTAIINKEIEEADKASLNESMIGGIVGVGAINQIPATPKTDYEMAFEHFLGERYQIKPNRERDDIKDVNEEEEVEEGKEGKMYFHVLQDSGYGEIGHQGVYDTEEEAQNRADSLSDMFSDSSFYVEASDSEDEPYSVTMEEGKEEVKEALQNDDMIYDRMMDMDQEQLISSMLSYAEQNPPVTLTDYLNDEFGYESEDELEEGKEVEEPYNY